MKDCLTMALGVLAVMGTAHADSTHDRSTFGTSAAGPPAAPQAVLYNQMDFDSGGGTGSQDFETVNDAFDTQAADDFVVPDGDVWSIEGIDTVGQYDDGPGPADSFNVTFYTDSASHLPGTVVESRPASAYTNDASASIVLDPPVELAYGTYWVSVQARMDFSPNGQWFWNDRTIASNNLSAFRNSGGAQSVCTAWDAKVICVPSSGPDMVFRLNGTIASAPLDTVFCSGFEDGEDGSCG